LGNVFLGSNNKEALNVANRACLMTFFYVDKTKIDGSKSLFLQHRGLV
jgi:hypothetical protein